MSIDSRLARLESDGSIANRLERMTDVELERLRCDDSRVSRYLKTLSDAELKGIVEGHFPLGHRGIR